jgi:hypothetical protein
MSTPSAVSPDRQKDKKTFDFDRFLDRAEWRILKISVLIGTIIFIVKILIYELK